MYFVSPDPGSLVRRATHQTKWNMYFDESAFSGLADRQIDAAKGLRCIIIRDTVVAIYDSIHQPMNAYFAGVLAQVGGGRSCPRNSSVRPTA